MFAVTLFGWPILLLIFNAVDFAALTNSTKELCTQPDDTLKTGGIAYQCNICWCIGKGVPFCTNMDCNRVAKPLWGTLTLARGKKKLFGWLIIVVKIVIPIVVPLAYVAARSFVSGFFHRLGERTADLAVDNLINTVSKVNEISRKSVDKCDASEAITGTLCKVSSLLDKESSKARSRNIKKDKELFCKVAEMMDAGGDINCNDLKTLGTPENDYCDVIELLTKEDIVCSKSEQIKMSEIAVNSVREIVKQAVPYLAAIGY